MEKSEVQSLAVGQVWKGSKHNDMNFAVIKYVGAKHVIYYFGVDSEEAITKDLRLNSKSSELSDEIEKFLERYSPTKFSYQIQ